MQPRNMSYVDDDDYDDKYNHNHNNHRINYKNYNFLVFE